MSSKSKWYSLYGEYGVEGLGATVTYDDGVKLYGLLHRDGSLHPILDDEHVNFATILAVVGGSGDWKALKWSKRGWKLDNSDTEQNVVKVERVKALDTSIPVDSGLYTDRDGDLWSLTEDTHEWYLIAKNGFTIKPDLSDMIDCGPFTKLNIKSV